MATRKRKNAPPPSNTQSKTRERDCSTIEKSQFNISEQWFVASRRRDICAAGNVFPDAGRRTRLCAAPDSSVKDGREEGADGGKKSSFLLLLCNSGVYLGWVLVPGPGRGQDDGFHLSDTLALDFQSCNHRCEVGIRIITVE